MWNLTGDRPHKVWIKGCNALGGVIWMHRHKRVTRLGVELERLDEFGGAIRTVWTGRDFRRCIASRHPEGSAVQKGIESRRHGRGVIRLANQPAAEAGVVHAGGRVELIEREWRDEQLQSRRERIHSAGPATYRTSCN